jgi:hypothetical protein
MLRATEVRARVAALAGLLVLLLSSGCNGGAEEGKPPSTTPAASPTSVTTTTPVAGEFTAIPLNGTSILVDSTGDSDGRDGTLTLREAIKVAVGELTAADLDAAEADNISGTPGSGSADTIIFHPSLFPADAPATISLTSILPALGTGGDNLDGSGSGVIIDGGNQGFNCFQVDSNDNAIKGLRIQNCRTAIVVGETASSNTIGGSAEGARNVIGPNDGVGIEIDGDGNVVQGNYIGTDASGTESRPNAMEGIWIAPGAENNVVGGTGPGERNVIAGNNLFGISIDGAGATGNVVQGNYIGVDVTGRVALKNRYGLVLAGGAQNNVIGGKEPGEANVISGNQSAGVLIRGSDTSGNVLKANFIGTDASGSEELRQGTGIWILEGAQGNVIGGTAEGEGNVIAHSGTVGVLIDGAETIGNTIRGNSIHSNARGAIVSRNGGNLGLAQPTIDGSGPLKGTACPDCAVDVYSGSEEGQVYQGSTTADGAGAFTFDGALPGPIVTVTATDAGGNTSPYSEPFPVPAS